MSEISLKEAFDLVDMLMFQSTGKHLNDIETIVFEGSWQGKTYEEIAEGRYSADYLNKDAGNKFWKKLSDALNEQVGKKNFKEALKRKWEQQSFNSIALSNKTNQTSITEKLPFPNGLVPPDSPIYIERDGVESRCNEEINKKGSLIRIKSPHLMGKTSLMVRLLKYVEEQHFKSVYLDFRDLEKTKLEDLKQLLRWLCFKVGQKLKLENRLNDYWDGDILGNNDNCTGYFEEYILPSIDCPLVLAIDNVDVVFLYSEVIDDFFGMLRSWHEKAKTHDVWGKLRLVISHSTANYITLDVNQSPFNVGLPIQLQEFTTEQISRLVNLHQLNLHLDQVEDLMRMIGGHPYLIRLALYHLKEDNITLNKLIKESPTEVGIYSNYLRDLQKTLKSDSNLVGAYKRVVMSTENDELDSIQIYKLHSLGLVNCYENYVSPRCNLYRQYFSRVL